jgi:predicted metalloprotease
MRWDRSYRSNDVEDRRSSSGYGAGAGSGLPLGALLAVGSRFGWKGILVAIVIVGALAYGGVCTGSSLCSGIGGQSSEVTPSQAPASNQPDELAHFVGFVLDDVQGYWAKQLPNYPKARLVLFRNAIGSGCGTASTAVGPFYCPTDRKVYVDLGFYDELRSKFGAPGDFAQAYVIAHEVGHHVQNLRGRLGREDKIAIELQADCLAGAWAGDAEKRKELEVGDIDEALTAAAAVGDDTIQRRTQGRVQPETWTHGSAQQRSTAFKTGFQRGPAGCGL